MISIFQYYREMAFKQNEDIEMVQKRCVSYGSDVSAGTYEYEDCGHRYSNQSKTSLPLCPKHNPSTHSKNCWNILCSGQGDAPEDPYPNRK